jgi:predicted DNA-binding transcriptional regulator YafY
MGWVLGFGAEARVLEPAGLRQAVRDQHHRAAALNRPA